MKTELISNAYRTSTGIDSDCISIMFHRPTNTGAFSVNGIPVPDGETLTISQNKGDLDTTKYIIRFASNTDATNQCVVAKIVPFNLEQYCVVG